MANLKEIDKSYISDYDKFLYEFDKKNTPSQSQLDEKKKHAQIAKLRDGDVEGDAPPVTS